jgi:hypothetical protein
MSSDGEVAEKVLDKVTGILEKLVDFRMLVLGMTLAIYLDIWLVMSHVNAMEMTLVDAMASLHVITVSTLMLFVVSYSLLMAATLPSLRVLYTKVFIYCFHSKAARDRSLEDKQLSTWCLGLIIFTTWDSVVGYFQPMQSYKGLVSILFGELITDGFVMSIFRVTVGLFLLFCTVMAFQIDE